MTVNRLLINLITEQLTASAAFYTRYFDFEIDFDSDWFVHLISKEKSLEIGLIHPNSEIVPKEVAMKPGGYYLTLVIEDVDSLYEQVQADGVEVLQEPHDTFYGQRRLLIEDLNGVVIDVSSPMR
ncbi:MAG: VOC family protein [Cytophagales bacterium]|nr:VOC family protein [Cytophagales bacterium]